MKSIYLMVAAIFTATPMLLQAVDSYTEVVGYNKTTFPAGSSLQGVGFVKMAIHTGLASKQSATTLSSSGLSAANNSLAPSGGLPTHYVEIVSGPNEGLLFDIVANNGTQVTVDGDLTGVASSEQIAIRPHVKLSEVFAQSSGLTDYNDSISVFQGDGSSLVFLRDSSVASGWLDASTFTESDSVIYPCQGFVLGAGSSGDFTFTGAVKSSKTVVPLFANAVNIVTVGNPSASSVDVQAINLGANLADYSDSAAIFSNSGSLSQDHTLLWGGSADGFLDASTFTPVTGLGVGGTAGFVVSVGASTTWTVNAPYTSP